MESDIKDLIRIGKVSSINPEKMTARVIFEDKGDFVSRDFPVITPFTLADKAYYMPTVGERVLCISQSNDASRGFILGSFYADTRKTPVNNADKFHTAFSDGTLLEYDKQSHSLTIECAGDIIIKAKGVITLSGSSINLN